MVLQERQAVTLHLGVRSAANHPPGEWVGPRLVVAAAWQQQEGHLGCVLPDCLESGEIAH